jgi:hypothetical protein
MKLEKSTARKLYPESPEWFKKELIEAFGKDCLEKKSFKEIKTFEDACEELDIMPDGVFSITDTSDEIAYMKLKTIIKAINQGWTPDWNNSNQEKWYPWFNLSSGFGFSCSGCICDWTYSGVGSRLCFKSEENSNYAAKQFLDLYEEFLTIKQ